MVNMITFQSHFYVSDENSPRAFVDILSMQNNWLQTPGIYMSYEWQQESRETEGEMVIFRG